MNRFCSAITLHDYLVEKGGEEIVSIGKRKHSYVIRIQNSKNKGLTIKQINIEQIAICEIDDIKYIPHSERRIKAVFHKLIRSNSDLYAPISANFLEDDKYWGSKEDIKKQSFNTKKYPSSA